MTPLKDTILVEGKGQIPQSKNVSKEGLPQVTVSPVQEPEPGEGHLESEEGRLLPSAPNEVEGKIGVTASDSDFNDASETMYRYLKAYKEGSKHFRRQGGIIYVPNDLWVKYYSYGINSHLYVSSASSVNPNPLVRGEGQIHQNLGTQSRSPNPKPSQQPSQLLTNGAGVGTKNILPDRVKFNNELLKLEMQRIVGVSDLSHDHVMPFRSIIPYEQQFRALLGEKEKEFADLAALHPNDPAVKRKEYWLPNEFAYCLKFGTHSNDSRGNTTNVVSWLDRSRTLLDGLRTLIHFLDHDLADLVRTYRKIHGGALEKIPFTYLWHLFWPGQEIVSKRPNHQVYRVLQVSGGRKSLTPRSNKSRSSFRRTVSNLVIDCFYLDFDGKKVRPVPKTISIQPYDDLRPITTLEVYPLRYEKERPRENLIQRGRKFVELVQVSHRRYKGLNLTESGFDKYEEVCLQ
jgi:hypothetical protein